MRAENKDISIYIKERISFNAVLYNILYITQEIFVTSLLLKICSVNPWLDYCCISIIHYINQDTYFLKRGN